MNPIDIFPNAAQLDADQRSASPTVSVLPLVLTVEAAADRLGVGRTLMYALVKSGAVESVTIGRLRRIPADALTDLLRQDGGEGLSPPLNSSAPHGARGSGLS